MRKSVLMLIAAAVIDLTASQRTPAADIARGSPRPYAPQVYVPPPVLIPSWTGCYVGGNIGGAWSNVDLSGVSGVNVSASNGGVAGGGQIGCDYQAGAWVFGIRNMLDGTSLSSNTNISTLPSQAPSTVARAGLTLRRLASAISYHRRTFCFMRKVAQRGPIQTLPF